MGLLTAFLQAPGLQAWYPCILVSLRVATVFALTPVLQAFALPGLVRACVLLGLALAVSAGLEPQDQGAAVVRDAGALLQAACVEVALGATLGLGVSLAFAAFAVAGSLLDAQIGFGIAQVLDPASRRPVSLLNKAMTYAGALAFFLVGGHHALLRGIAYSLEVFPPGRPWQVEHAAGAIVAQAAGVFGLGFALAAPVVFCILLVELALGVIARNLPQMNMLALGFPVKILVGLLALSSWFASGIGSVMLRVYAGIHMTWSSFFAAAVQMQGAR